MARRIGKAWGNALGGYKLQNRVGGKFASGFSGSSKKVTKVKTPSGRSTPAQRRAQYLDGKRKEAQRAKRKKTVKKAATAAAVVGVVGGAAYAAHRSGNLKISAKRTDEGVGSVNATVFGKKMGFGYDASVKGETGIEGFIGKRRSSKTFGSAGTANPSGAKTSKGRSRASTTMRGAAVAASISSSAAQVNREIKSMRKEQRTDQHGVGERASERARPDQLALFNVRHDGNAPHGVSPVEIRSGEPAAHGFSGGVSDPEADEMWQMRYEHKNNIGTKRITGEEASRVEASARALGESSARKAPKSVDHLDEKHWDATGTAVEVAVYDGGDEMNRPYLGRQMGRGQFVDANGTVTRARPVTRGQAKRNADMRKKIARDKAINLPQVQARQELSSSAVGRGRGKAADAQYGMLGQNPQTDEWGYPIRTKSEDLKSRRLANKMAFRAVDESRRMGYKSTDDMLRHIASGYAMDRLEASWPKPDPTTGQIQFGNTHFELDELSVSDVLSPMRPQDLRMLKRTMTDKEFAFVRQTRADLRAGKNVNSRRVEASNELLSRAFSRSDPDFGSIPTQNATRKVSRKTGKADSAPRLAKSKDVRAEQEKYEAILREEGLGAIGDRNDSANLLAGGAVENRDTGTLDKETGDLHLDISLDDLIEKPYLYEQEKRKRRWAHEEVPTVVPTMSKSQKDQWDRFNASRSRGRRV